MRLYDNTRLSEYKKCPRKYYFRHMRHWIRKGVKPAPLAFGGAWHSAMDVVWGMISQGEKDDDKVGKEAMKAFLRTWKEEEQPWPMDIEQEKMMAPRTPGIAAEMLVEYIRLRRNYIENTYELVSIEEPFLAPIDPSTDYFGYIGKRDKIVKFQGQYWAIEHKTTTLYDKKHGFRQSYLDSYSPNSQTDGYAHSLHMRYGKQAGGVLVDIALVHKTEHSWFKLLPLTRRTELLDSWLNDTRDWIFRIERDRDRLANDVSEEHEVMTAFPRNTESCFNYNTMCSYRDVCRFHENPHRLETPDNFTEDKWNPVEELHLEKIGINDED